MKLHIHSDCYKWGGSENMIAVFLQDQILNKTFDVSFSYRYSKEYFIGMKKWVNNIDSYMVKYTPLFFPITFLYKIKKYFPPIMTLGYFSAVIEIMKLFQLFKRVKPNILHIINGGYPGASSCNSAVIAGRLAGVPKITYFITSTTKNPWWYWLMTFLVKHCGVTFISASNKLRVESDFLGDDWQQISNTIRDIEIRPREDIRKELNIPLDETVYLCIGDLVKRKGFDKAIDSFSLMTEIGTPRSFLLSGNGSEVKSLKEKMKNKERGVYRFFGDLPCHPYELINACDVLISPSLGEEDWPNVILIAMKYSLPCIVSNICGLPEMIDPGNNGFVFSDGKELTRFMDLLLDKDIRTTMGQRAKEHYQRKYRQEKIINKYIELWEETK